MKEFELKYGCNPNQKPSRIYMKDGRELPVEILCGRPGYINFLDAFNSWQLVSEIKSALGRAAATSFKHVSPTSAAIGEPMSRELKKACFADDVEGLDDSELATAYARARGTDRCSSFGDWIALSDVCDVTTAKIIKHEVSDGIIAPGYEPEALEILRSKRKGNYNIVKIDPSYVPEPIETKDVFGVTFEQGRNNFRIDRELFNNIVTANKNLPEAAVRDLIISLITLKYTQSNSDTLAKPERDNAVDFYLSDEFENDDLLWRGMFSRRPEVLTREEKREYLDSVTGVSLGSDAFFPFGDNIERAAKSGVSYVAQPGGSVRDDNVIAACDRFGMTMCFTGMRLFHH